LPEYLIISNDGESPGTFIAFIAFIDSRPWYDLLPVTPADPRAW
jgi:hypothetical protein